MITGFDFMVKIYFGKRPEMLKIVFEVCTLISHGGDF